MKNKILFGAMLLSFCTFSLQSNAQLEVKTTGDVEISKKLKVKNNLTVLDHEAIGDATANDNIDLYIKRTSSSMDPYYGIKSHLKTKSSLATSSICAVYGYSDAIATKEEYPSVNHIVGVFGAARKPSEIISRFAAGVAGVAIYYGGIGVYGGLSFYDMDIPSSAPETSAYAGYFAGTVKVNGTLFATTVTTTSDLRQKENVQQIPLSLAENIRLLNPVSYTLKQDTMWKYDIEAKELQGTHYGLIAQDVQKIFPELVYERGEKLSINYIELIPLLIKTIQDLSTEVEELKASKYAKSPAFTANRPSEDALQAILYQNQPNPFSAETQIGYQLPQTTRNATLYVYNMNGSQVAEYPITTFGEGHVIVSAGTLDAGMYFYSLIADGQVVDTKRMILTN